MAGGRAKLSSLSTLQYPEYPEYPEPRVLCASCGVCMCVLTADAGEVRRGGSGGVGRGLNVIDIHVFDKDLCER